MLLRNARISGDPVDVLIENGTITSIAPGASTDQESVDLDGRWLTPGLWDNHVHFTQWTLGSRRVDISEAGSAREAAGMVAAHLRGLGRSREDTGEPFIAVGFRDGLWPDAPNLADLDEAAGSQPVVVISADLHAVWLNSAALGHYGLSGHSTGLLREDAAFEITRLIDAVPEYLLDAWAHQTADAAAARGVVGIIDYEMNWNLDVWQRRIAAGTTSLRVEFGVYSEHLERAIALGLRTGDRVGELLTVGGYKVITDGSLNTRTAYCYDEYPGLEGTPHSHGVLTVPPEQLLPLMQRASAAGIVPAVHAIGDHANALVLDAFEALGVSGRIEHAQLLSERDLGRFAQLGVVASVQPEQALDDRDVADRHWAGRTSRAFVLRSLLDVGAELALGSDAPVAPLDPWITIAAAVARTRGDREPWHPEQTITIAEAIAASTRSRVAVGQPADIVVTDVNPLQQNPESLRGMSVAATLLGGRFTHNALA